MSFSANVKSELSHHFGNARHCNIAELSAVINMCGVIVFSDAKFCIKIQTENVAVARKCFTLVKKTFNIDTEILIRRNSQLKKNRIYMLFIKGRDDVSRVLSATGILRFEGGVHSIRTGVYPLVVNSVCCRRAYIRGAYLAGGSISDPEKAYHLEFVNSSAEHASSLKELINSFDLDSKIIKRKGQYIVYLKEGEQIVKLLSIMEAHVALMDFENIRILKDMRNNVNRMVNCETANLAKTVTASVKQVEDIKYIRDTIGLSRLPEQLRSVAALRLEFPDASLKELGGMMDSGLGKSGVNHRLRKIGEIAEALRKRM